MCDIFFVVIFILLFVPKIADEIVQEEDSEEDNLETKTYELTPEELEGLLGKDEDVDEN